MATNNKYNEVRAFLRENAYPYYSDLNGSPSGALQRRSEFICRKKVDA